MMQGDFRSISSVDYNGSFSFLFLKVMQDVLVGTLWLEYTYILREKDGFASEMIRLLHVDLQL